MNKRNVILVLLFTLTISFLMGEVIWQDTFNPFGADGINVRPYMQICSDGSYAVTGYYVVEDPYGGYLEWRGYVMKVSSEGELLWAKSDTLSFMGENESNCIIETNDGGLINAGDGYMIKRDSDGNRLWSKDLDYAPYSMCYSHDGNIIVTGGTPNQNTLFRKIDHDGNEILNNDFILDNSTSIRRIIPTSDNGYAMTGSITHDEGYHGDIIIVKTNSFVDTLWTYRKDGNGESDSGHWIVENSEQNIFVCGEIVYDTRDYLSGYGVLLNLNGDIIWERDTPEEMTGLQQFYTIDLPEENSLMIYAGSSGFYKCNYSYTIDWIDEDDELLMYSRKNNNGFIFYQGGIDGVQLKKTDNNIVSTEENIMPAHQSYLRCYPNPFKPSQQRSSEITIKFDNLKSKKNSQINIYNIKGRRVKQFELSKRQTSVQWNGGNTTQKQVSSGVYFVTLNSGGKTIDFKKITIIK